MQRMRKEAPAEQKKAGKCGELAKEDLDRLVQKGMRDPSISADTRNKVATALEAKRATKKEAKTEGKQ